MADLGDKLRPVAQSLLQPGENLLGCCVATRSGLFSGQMVAIAITERRLVVQPLTRRFSPDGEPLSLPPERIADARAGSGGGGWPTIGSAILDGVSVTLTLRTTDGDKLKLLMMHGSGPLGGLAGGEAQRQGVEAFGAWFARHAAGR
jgi:hypothetical protein